MVCCPRLEVGLALASKRELSEGVPVSKEGRVQWEIMIFPVGVQVSGVLV